VTASLTTRLLHGTLVAIPGDSSLCAHGGAFLASGLAALTSALVASRVIGANVRAHQAFAFCSAFASALGIASVQPLRSAARVCVPADPGAHRVRPVACVPGHWRDPSRLCALSRWVSARAEKGGGRRPIIGGRGGVWGGVWDRRYLPWVPFPDYATWNMLTIIIGPRRRHCDPELMENRKERWLSEMSWMTQQTLTP
jgi:hypothetical protein